MTTSNIDARLSRRARDLGSGCAPAGLSQLVTQDVAGYVAKAVEIGSTPDAFASFRAQLMENIPHCWLF